MFRQAISESPAAGLTRSADVAARFAERFTALIGARRSDAAHALMAAPPAVLVNALDTLIDATGVDMLGAFPVGPSFGDDVLPVEPVEAMRTGRAHPVPLIVGTNADEARLFTRFLKLLPTTEHKIEALLAGAGAATRDRIIEAYPDYPAPRPVSDIGGDFAFSFGGLAGGRRPQRHHPDIRVPLRLRTAAASLVGPGRHARHRVVRGVRQSTRPGWAPC